MCAVCVRARVLLHMSIGLQLFEAMPLPSLNTVLEPGTAFWECVDSSHRHTHTNMHTHCSASKNDQLSLKPVSLCKVIRWKLIIPLKESSKASSEHCADKPAPRPGGPDGCWADCYMPHLSSAIWLDGDCELPLGNYRLKMDKFFWQKKKKKPFEVLRHTWIPDPTMTNR